MCTSHAGEIDAGELAASHHEQSSRPTVDVTALFAERQRTPDRCLGAC